MHNNGETLLDNNEEVPISLLDSSLKLVERIRCVDDSLC